MEFVELIRASQIEEIKQRIAANPTLVNAPDERGFTPLILAAYRGQKEIAELLLANGAEIDAQDVMGNTALMGASFKGLIELVEMLLLKNANVHLSNKAGDTALSFARNYKQSLIEQLLLAAACQNPPR